MPVATPGKSADTSGWTWTVTGVARGVSDDDGRGVTALGEDDLDGFINRRGPAETGAPVAGHPIDGTDARAKLGRGAVVPGGDDHAHELLREAFQPLDAVRRAPRAG